MPKRPLADPQYWRDRAEEARTRAEQIKDPDNKHIMLRIAEGHERQAALLEKQLRDSQNST
jgi:bacterioferritin (cytochrome b1)